MDSLAVRFLLQKYETLIFVLDEQQLQTQLPAGTRSITASPRHSWTTRFFKYVLTAPLPTDCLNRKIRQRTQLRSRLTLESRKDMTLERVVDSSILFRLPQFLGCLFRNAPTEPKYPSCLRKYACFSPFDQNLIAYDSVFIVCVWPRIKDPPK